MAEKTKKELAVVKASSDLMTIPLTAENVVRFIEPTATMEEVALFLNQCAMFGLNPFKREIYLIKYSKEDPATFVVGYEAYLKRAERSGKWQGMETGVEKNAEGNVLSAWARVYRQGWKIPLSHQVSFSEYVQTKEEWKDNVRTGKRIPTKFWREKPETMLKKVAIAQAIRLAFPDETGGLPYIQEEIHAGEEGPSLRDIAIATGAKVDEIAKTPLPDVKDEFTNPEEFPEEKPAEEKPARRSEPSMLDLAEIAKKISTIKSISTFQEETIYAGINASLRKAGFPQIVELGELTIEGVAHIKGYLDLWLVDIKNKKDQKNGTKKK